MEEKIRKLFVKGGLTMKQVSKLFALALSTLASAAILMSCGGGGGGGDLQSPSTDLTGNWSVTEVDNGNCQGSVYPHTEHYTASASQSGNNFTLTNTTDNSTKSGTISGNTVTINNTYTDFDGTTSGSFSGTVSSDGNSFSGRATWTWTGSSSSCSGTTDVTATRI